jgi:hypothetical protein
MDRAALLRKLEAILVKAEQEKTFGAIEIELRAGRATIIRLTTTDRLEEAGERTHAKTNFR